VKVTIRLRTEHERVVLDVRGGQGKNRLTIAKKHQKKVSSFSSSTDEEERSRERELRFDLI
jgi:hypothetical protein